MLQRSALVLLPFTAVLASIGCSSGGGGGSDVDFELIGVSVTEGSVWEINREIELTFSEPLDFATVSANTIHLRSADDVPATGVFRLRDPRTVVFQPTCPTRADFSDAGLLPGGTDYVLRVPGIDTSPNVVRSAAGKALGVQQTRSFSTPASSSLSEVFHDVRSGPPLPVVRAQGSSERAATHLEIGGDPDRRVYFERDPGGDLVLSEPGFAVPLNLYADLASRVAVVIELDQPVNPSATNISETRLRLEFEDALGRWLPIDTRVTLERNCTETGARVRLEPIGVLPPGTSFRAVLLPGFQDVVGEANLVVQASFARAPTRTVEFTSLDPADALSDAFHESFDFGAPSPLAFEDTDAAFDTPAADWGGGELSAAFAFDGTGGPGGDFDWIVRPGEIFFFDTTLTSIIGGPDGIPAVEQTARGGVLDVRDLWIQAGGRVRVQGPNPLRIHASGEVRIDGELDVSGWNAKDVATLNTGGQFEVGGAGTAGGGRGGHASENTSGHTVRGSRGNGPFGQPGLGGEGGEMGFAQGGKDNRRPGGGGGGRFSKDWPTDPEFPDRPTLVDLSVAATAGTDGSPVSFGADFGAGVPSQPARGGMPGAGPFLDSRDDNDFFGTRPLVEGEDLVGLVRGELPSLWAGYGGGGGGNAGEQFPVAVWGLGTDEKGGGGGGAAGALHVKALGRIVFGAEGSIRADGARGATGENTLFLDHIAGTGGGGSGGHVVLESATAVDFTDGGANASALPRDYVTACGPLLRKGPTDDVCNPANATAICFNPACVCQDWSNGGAGGAGVIQIHVPDAITAPSDSPDESDVVVPTAALALPEPLDLITSPPAYRMIPTFAARSKARSRWISVGGADHQPGSAQEGLVRFLFEGLDAEGLIRAEDGRVVDPSPLVAEADLSASSSARLLEDGFTLELRGAALDALRSGATSGISNDVYLRTPALLSGCTLRMRVSVEPGRTEDFTVASAEHDEGEPALGDEILRVTVSSENGRLTEFNPGDAGGPTGFQLLPRFFAVVTGGLAGALPETATVRVTFQAAAADGNGAPDERAPLTPWTADITELNRLPPGRLQFFRYEVEFELDAGGLGVSTETEPVSLEFLKIPFVF